MLYRVSAHWATTVDFLVVIADTQQSAIEKATSAYDPQVASAPERFEAVELLGNDVMHVYTLHLSPQRAG